MAHQGLLDEYGDYNEYEADFKQAQQPFKPSIRPPTVEDWERMRKYFGYVPAKMVRNTYKHYTQYGVLPPSSHLSPNPLLNPYPHNEADATDQIFSDSSAMNGGE